MDLNFPSSLYAQTARKATQTEPLIERIKVHVVIVGGGISGLSTALHLAEKGVDVAVIEQAEPGFGASGRNGGQVNPGFHADAEELCHLYGKEAGEAIFAVGVSATNTVFDLIERYNIDCEAQQSGTLRLACYDNALEKIKNTYNQWEKRNAGVKWLDKEACISATGTNRYVGGMLFERGGKVNPLGYTRGLVDAALTKGAKIYSQTKAIKLENKQSHWILTTQHGLVEAKHIVLVTNGYTDSLWPKLQQSIIPVFSTITATQPLSDDIASRILPNGSVLYEGGYNTIYYRLDKFNRLLMGGGGRQSDMTPDYQALHLKKYAKRIFPFLESCLWSHVWNGHVAITKNHIPHFHEPAENLHINIAYNGRGVAMATTMGKLLAGHILGEKEFVMPKSDIKKIAFHALWPFAVRSRLAYGAFRDSLAR